MRARAGVSDGGRFEGGLVAGAAWLRHGRRRPRQDDGRRRAIIRAARKERPASAVGARVGRRQYAGAGADARQRDAVAGASSTRSWRSCGSTRSPIRTTPGRGSVASFRRCTTSACRRRRTAISTTSRRGPASAAIASTRMRRRGLHDVHRRMGERQHPQQGPARQALSVPVLHPRRRHAVVSRPDRQRPGELHEPDATAAGAAATSGARTTARRDRSGRRAATRSRAATIRGTR